MAAGMSRSVSRRCRKRRFSTDTPIQTLAGQVRPPARSRARSGRFVSTWKVCQSARRIVSNTCPTYSSGISSWKRSLMLLTKIMRGFRHDSGSSSRSGRSVSSKPCSYGWPGTPLKRLANVSA